MKRNFSVLMLLVSALWLWFKPNFDSLVNFLGLFQTKEKDEMKEPPQINLTPTPPAEKPDRLRQESDLYFARLHRLWEAHGLKLEQLLDYAPEKFGLTRGDFLSNEHLAQKITTELNQWIADLFWVRFKWLTLGTGSIYERRDYYKCDWDMFEQMAQISVNSRFYEVTAVKAHGDLDFKNQAQQTVVVFLSQTIQVKPGFEVTRYFPISTDWNWGYWRSRLQFKVFSRICTRYFNGMNGLSTDQATLSALLCGDLIPNSLELKSKRDWYPDWYSDLPSENCTTYETEETQDVIEFINQKDYLPLVQRLIDQKTNELIYGKNV